MSNKSENIYFKICRFLALDIFEAKAVKIMIRSNIFTFGLLCGFQTFLFVQKANLNYFIQYGPTYFMALYILLCLVGLLVSLPTIRTSTEFMRSWKFSNPDGKIENKHYKELISITLYFVIVTCFGLITGISYIVPTEEDQSIFFELKIFEEYFSKWQSFFTTLYRFSVIPIAFCAVVEPCFQNIYFWHHLKYHFAHCLHHLKTIDFSDDLEIPEQNKIANELKCCLQYHVQICQTFQEYVKKSQLFIYLFYAVGTLLVGNIVIYYFSFREFLYDQFPRILSLGVTSFLILAGLAQNGQEIEDVSSDIFDVLINIEWYNWNEDNKKMYLMFLANSQKPLKFKFSENISVNYKMGVEIIKGFFSAISIMRKLKRD